MDKILDILPFRLLYKRTINGESLSISSIIIRCIAVCIDLQIRFGKNYTNCIKCLVSKQIKKINRMAQLPFVKKLSLEGAQRRQYFLTRRDIRNYRKNLAWTEMRPNYFNTLSDDVMIYMLQYISVDEGYSQLLYTLNKQFYEMWCMRVFYTISDYLCMRNDQTVEYIHYIFRCLTHHQLTNAIVPMLSYVSSYKCMIDTVSMDILFDGDRYQYNQYESKDMWYKLAIKNMCIPNACVHQCAFCDFRVCGPCSAIYVVNHCELRSRWTQLQLMNKCIQCDRIMCYNCYPLKNGLCAECSEQDNREDDALYWYWQRCSDKAPCYSDVGDYDYRCSCDYCYFNGSYRCELHGYFCEICNGFHYYERRELQCKKHNIITNTKDHYYNKMRSKKRNDRKDERRWKYKGKRRNRRRKKTARQRIRNINKYC